jgi:hypothetical protein
MSTAPITYQLDQQHVERLLVALRVFQQQCDNPYAQELASQARTWYGFAPSADDCNADNLGCIADVLFEGLLDARRTPAERLLDYEVDGLTDEDALAIVRDIEARHGKITPEDLAQVLAS